MKRYLMAAVLAVAAIIGVTLVKAQTQTKPITAPAPKADSGRYQIIAQPGTTDIMGNVYLLDTDTGRVWRQIRLSDAEGDDNGLAGEPTVWMPMTRLDSAADLLAFGRRNPKPKDAK